MRLICKILIILIFSGIAQNVNGQQKTHCLENIYGEKYIFNKTDSVVLMVFIKSPSCVGCKDLLFKLFDKKNLNSCKKIIVYTGRGGIVHKKNNLTEAKNLLPGSKCLFYYKDIIQKTRLNCKKKIK